jgi:hypothetical protein
MTPTQSNTTLSVKPNLVQNCASYSRSSPWLRAISKLVRPPAIILIVLGLLLSRGITQGEPFFSNDETRHVMNGVFIRDLLVDRPNHPFQYTYEYYAKYPAIAIPHWPPFFTIVEAFFFLVFGISVWASRLAILSFALLGSYYWYQIAERHGPRSRALLSAFIFCLLPPVMIFESVTMLEIPQVALCLGAIYYWLRWVEDERARDLCALAGFATAAMLTYPASIFLALFLGLDFLLERRFRLLRNWRVWVALVASLAIVSAWYLFSFHTVTHGYQQATGHGFQHLLRTRSDSYYLRTLPGQLGPVLLVLACIGIGWAVRREARRYRFLLLWVASAYLCFTLIAEKAPRHIMIWLPPLVYFSLLGVEVLLPRRRWFWLAYATLGLYFLVGALLFHRPQLTGMEPVAQFVLAQPESDVLYYQGRLDGDFVFRVRQLDPQKRHLIARDKQVEVSNISYSRRQVLQTPDQILNFFQTWGVRYAVIENVDPYPELELVRRVLQSDQFELIRAFPIQAKGDFEEVTMVSVYRYRGELHRSTQPVEIPMMTIYQDISADLNRLASRSWPN